MEHNLTVSVRLECWSAEHRKDSINVLSISIFKLYNLKSNGLKFFRQGLPRDACGQIWLFRRNDLLCDHFLSTTLMENIEVRLRVLLSTLRMVFPQTNCSIPFIWSLVESLFYVDFFKSSTFSEFCFVIWKWCSSYCYNYAWFLFLPIFQMLSLLLIF